MLYSEDEDELDDTMSLPPMDSSLLPPSTPNTPSRATPPLPDTPLPRETNNNNNSLLDKLDAAITIKTEESDEGEYDEGGDGKTEQENK